MSKERRSRITVIFFLPFLTLIMLAFCYLSGMITNIPERAEQLFGPPSPSLGTARLYYQSFIISLDPEKLTTPVNPMGETVVFTILPGDSPEKVIQQLSRANLVDYPQVFRAYLVYSGLDTRIQAGEYSLSQAMSPVEIAEVLQDATPTDTTFTLLAGWRAEEIGAALPVAGVEISPTDFAEEVQKQSAEGFLFPATYSLPRNISPVELVTIFKQEFESQVTFESDALSLQEVVILASIVEREAVLDEEMPMIASVFVNRLRANMTLGADPTVQYALGFDAAAGVWWKNPLSVKDLEIDSPYNTYIYGGLPPGPICNPSLAALQAAAAPAQTNYYYFRAACDGSGRHLFSETYEEHLGKGCE